MARSIRESGIAAEAHADETKFECIQWWLLEQPTQQNSEENEAALEDEAQINCFAAEARLRFDLNRVPLRRGHVVIS